MTDPPVLTTERLILRPYEMSDAPAMHRLVGAAEVAYNTLRIPHPYPDGAAEEWIATHQQKFEEKSEVVLAITMRDSGELVGTIGMVLGPFDKAEIGYWIGVPYWGRGYATEAVGALIRYGFEVLGLNRIESNHFTRNPSSGRVMEKNGMRCEGLLRQAVKKGGEYLDIKFYGILREDWANARVIPSREDGEEPPAEKH
ncbi:MAG: GNAT family N-acetyltransferase [Thermoanaerobaculia bacterium]